MKNQKNNDTSLQCVRMQNMSRNKIILNSLNISDADSLRPNQATRLTLPPEELSDQTDIQVPYHIMIVDDDEINNYMLMRRLQTVDPTICISTAVNGHDALGKLNQFILNADIVFPQLLLVDLEMPICNGFEFLDLYEEEFASFFPATELFVLTSSALESDKKKVKAFQAVSRFISKPLPLSLIS